MTRPLVAALVLIPAFAQSAGAKAEECDGASSSIECLISAKSAKKPIITPDSPALAALDLTKTPNVPRDLPDLVLGLVSIANPDGSIAPGLALDINPFMMAVGSSYSLGEYREETVRGWLRRWASNTRLSFATADASDGVPIRLAVGLFSQPWILKEHDPRRNTEFSDCLVKAMGAKLPMWTADQTEWENRKRTWLDDVEKSSDIPACREKYKDVWNATAVAFGVSPVFTSDDGSFGSLEYSGFGVWTSLSFALPIGQGLIAARFIDNDVVEGASGREERDLLLGSVGYRMKLGDANGLLANNQVGVEAAYVLADYGGGREDDYGQFAATWAFTPNVPQLLGTLLEVSIGTTAGASVVDGGSFGKIGIKLSYTDNSAK